MEIMKGEAWLNADCVGVCSVTMYKVVERKILQDAAAKELI